MSDVMTPRRPERPTSLSPADAAARLTAAGQVPAADLQLLQTTGPATAVKDSPEQWPLWWSVCVAGQIVFLPFSSVMAGRWSPRTARQDAERHEQAVQRELQAMGMGMA